MKIDNPLPYKYPEDFLARRCCIHRYTQAELAIREALLQVEALGADLLLTQAVILLGQAQERVADWLEGAEGKLEGEK